MHRENLNRENMLQLGIKAIENNYLAKSYIKYESL